ncbi:dephospho-CoA kinase [Sporosarcina sp. NCCP-2716]|uniref:dephospho-CoA kinase n=1 Tax=Sporosarcina sp. NCCP-2716 TaxID=2943679 RepID=UPI0020422A83|nr:dephospho-CoA kinase [Sporosarcina sp. NCCP-2716]GKV69592.1 dephospho-CoA kinase [Sporosarcina sp. NCCP-2716]
MIIGLTGSIASGKSTVARMLKARGLPIVDADEIARLVVEPGSPVLKQIEEAFGPESLRGDGSMNREYVGKLVFSDKDKRLQLNAIIHPAIRKELTAQKEAFIEAGAETVVLDIPLLFENKLHSYAEKILVVSVSPDVQLRRLMERNALTKAEAEARISSQLPVAEKEAGADAVIYNNGTLDETEEQVDAVLAAWNIR